MGLLICNTAHTSRPAGHNRHLQHQRRSRQLHIDRAAALGAVALCKQGLSLRSAVISQHFTCCTSLVLPVQCYQPAHAHMYMLQPLLACSLCCAACMRCRSLHDTRLSCRQAPQCVNRLRFLLSHPCSHTLPRAPAGGGHRETVSVKGVSLKENREEKQQRQRTLDMLFYSYFKTLVGKKASAHPCYHALPLRSRSLPHSGHARSCLDSDMP